MEKKTRSAHLLTVRIRNATTHIPRTKQVARGPAPLHRHLKDVHRTIGRKFGFERSHILEKWPEIVGDSLAASIYPEKLSAVGKTGATLTIRTPSALSVEVQHKIPEILERINRFYGYAAIARIKLVQAPLPGGFQQNPDLWGAASAPDPSDTPVSTRETSDAESLIAQVQNPIIRSHLSRMRHKVSKSRQ